MGRGATFTFRCRAETVPKVRNLLESELRRHHVGEDLVDRLVLATAEACNNALIHSGCESYAVTVELDDEEATITVSDSGAGFVVPDQIEMPEPDAVSRRGLALMSALIDEVHVISTPAGTTVVLRQPLTSRVPQKIRVA
jgi:serine/threonine-protein kinase RsbW